MNRAVTIGFDHRHGANAITGFIEALDAHGCVCWSVCPLI
jgi:hypothetical protein